MGDYELIRVLGVDWLELYQEQAWGEPARVLVRVAEDAGRRRISQVLIADGSIDSDVLRSIPLARVEAMVNHPEWQAAIEQALKEGGPSLKSKLTPASRAVDRLLADTTLGAHNALTLRRDREPLTRPDGTDPDAFSRRVAAAYADEVMKTSRPAVVLAEEAGVPVGTVHRWIREARARGHLAPARRGRAG